VQLNGHYRIADVTKDTARILSRLDLEGLSFATQTLPCLSTGLLNLVEGHETSFPQFKLQRGTKHPTLFGRLFHLVLESTDERVKGKAFDLLYSLTVAFKKLKGDYPINVLRKQYADFLQTDKDLDALDFLEETTSSMLELARSYVYKLFRGFDLASVKALPQPGPGATNSRREKVERYRPHTLYKQINDVLPCEEWWFNHPWEVCLRSREWINLVNNMQGSPTARFKFVPKVANKPRGICIEENEMQVMQQAFRKYFYNQLKGLYPYIAIDDQSVNALLALESSLTRENATIDMSEGSDRISRALVSYLFQDIPELHDILMALSTKFVVTPDEISEYFPALTSTNKYAPMGSALCFPVMCIVHLVLCWSIIAHNTCGKKINISECVYVYGDDIVIPSVFTEDIYTWLPKFGMKLNKTKSFYRSHFRESCGIHAYNGVDVTPVYQKYAPSHNNAKAVASALAVESQLYNKGWHETANFLRLQIREHYHINDYVIAGTSEAGFARPYTDEGLRLFKQNRRRKWNKNYQCYTYKSQKIAKSIIKKKINDDYDAYMRWMWTYAKGSGPPGSDFGSWVIGDSYGDLSKSTRVVLESALMEATISKLVEDNLRYPTMRVPKKRKDVVCHKVTQRQTSYLQQQGAAENCCFC
jgi:hypothetical protein